jgi:hypothetical protein
MLCRQVHPGAFLQLNPDGPQLIFAGVMCKTATETVAMRFMTDRIREEFGALQE